MVDCILIINDFGFKEVVIATGLDLKWRTLGDPSAFPGVVVVT